MRGRYRPCVHIVSLIECRPPLAGNMDSYAARSSASDTTVETIYMISRTHLEERLRGELLEARRIRRRNFSP